MSRPTKVTPADAESVRERLCTKLGLYLAAEEDEQLEAADALLTTLIDTFDTVNALLKERAEDAT